MFISELSPEGAQAYSRLQAAEPAVTKRVKKRVKKRGEATTFLLPGEENCINAYFVNTK